jgi:hypothetical protein
MVLEELQKKVEKLQKTQQMILLMREREAKLIAQNAQMNIGLDVDETEDTMKFNKSDDNEVQDPTTKATVNPPKPTVQKGFVPPTFKKPAPIQKRISDESKSSAEKKPKNSDPQSPSMQTPKVLTADIYDKFTEAGLATYSKFIEDNPNVTVNATTRAFLI